MTRASTAQRATSPTKAGAAVVAAPRSLEVREVSVPEPGPGEVRVRLRGAGVCGSSLPIWEGRPWFEYPLAPGAPGHEGWGVVDAVGTDAGDLREGESVAALSFHAHAEYDVAAADAVVRLPDELADVPFPGEPLGCAMNVFERSGIEAGQTVCVVGIGFLGALLVQLASAAGAHVVAVSRRDFALETARRAGADEAIRFGDPEAVAQRALEVTDGAGFDRVIEAVGVQQALDLAGRLPRVRGRLIIAGFHQDGHRQVDMQHWNWNGLDVVNAHERDPRRYLSGMREAVSAVLDGRLDPRPLLTHRFELHRADEAYEAMRARPQGFLKAWVAT